MKLFNTKHKRKSAILTLLLMLFVVFVLFAFGLDYQDPPDEYGVEVNFGYTDTGSGNNITSTEQVKTQPNEPQQEQKEETPVEEVKPQETTSTEEVLTQDTEEEAEVNNQPVSEPTTQTSDTKEEVKESVEPIKEETPKADKSTTDALNNILNGPSNNGTSNNGDGDGDKPGNQGKINGNPYANAYYGGGSGNGSGYGLNGRNKLGVKKHQQDCNEEGKVVVKIFVNRSGKVIKTTIQQSDDPCLNAAAKRTALSYKFDTALNAPATQTGFVIVNFSLGE